MLSKNELLSKATVCARGRHIGTHVCTHWWTFSHIVCVCTYGKRLRNFPPSHTHYYYLHHTHFLTFPKYIDLKWFSKIFPREKKVRMMMMMGVLSSTHFSSSWWSNYWSEKWSAVITTFAGVQRHTEKYWLKCLAISHIFFLLLILCLSWYEPCTSMKECRKNLNPLCHFSRFFVFRDQADITFHIEAYATTWME